MKREWPTLRGNFKAAPIISRESALKSYPPKKELVIPFNLRFKMKGQEALGSGSDDYHEAAPQEGHPARSKHGV